MGFKNKLLLKHQSAEKRSMLLLENALDFVVNGHHLNIWVLNKTESRVHALDIDSCLGRLVDAGSLQGRLYLAYLHGLSSHCLKDPLLGTTGTEEALRILRSAATRSFERLSQENVDVLSGIARLAPQRRFYPLYLRIMQSVQWQNSLSPLSQHEGLCEAVENILQQAKRSRLFYPEDNVVIPDLNINGDLHLRAKMRLSTYRTSDAGAEDFDTVHDRGHASRDRNSSSWMAKNVTVFSTKILTSETSLAWGLSEYCGDELWKILSGASIINGPIQQSELPRIEYDARLFQTSGRAIYAQFLPLIEFLGKERSLWNKHSLALWLSGLACSKNSDKPDKIILQALATAATTDCLVGINAPVIPSFHLEDGYCSVWETLEQLIDSAARPFKSSPDWRLVRFDGETKHAHTAPRQTAYVRNKGQVVESLANYYHGLSRCGVPETPDFAWTHEITDYIDVLTVVEKVKAKFKSWHNNYLLLTYLRELGDALAQLSVKSVQPDIWSLVAKPAGVVASKRYVSSADVFKAVPPPPFESGFTASLELVTSPANKSPDSYRLQDLVSRLETSPSAGDKYSASYLERLRESFKCLRESNNDSPSWRDLPTRDEFAVHEKSCQLRAEGIFEAMMVAVKQLAPPTKPGYHAAMQVQQWPRLSPVFFLQQLNRNRWQILHPAWKSCIVDYGLAIVALQRANRLVNASTESDVVSELLNVGHENWEPCQHPETLLLEVESRIIIREVQEQIAAEMRAPPDEANAVAQLNMGEGKSAVILPIVAAALADGSRLLRIIVAKPQSKQTAYTMTAKLGGLLDRRLYFLPFYRGLRIDDAGAQYIDTICRECMTNGGVLVVQPEHVLSLHLMIVESFISGKESLGRSLLNTHEQLFDAHARDLVDESDANFDVRFELIYTLGVQQPLEFSPFRWSVISHVLDDIRKLAHEFALSLEVKQGPTGCFPRTRILNAEGGLLLVNTVARKLCDTGLPDFSVGRQSAQMRDAVYKYITKSDLSEYEAAQVETYASDGLWSDSSSRQTLLLLRGLFAEGVLAFVFGQKRWRVNYGLTERIPQTQLAVPYKAKDQPAARAEFSHPDVVLLLSFLSHYYQGLSNEHLFEVFGHLLAADQANVKYQDWVKDAPTLKAAGFGSLESINIRDKNQCIEEVFPQMRFAKSVVDYYLSNLVFPRDMKEFPSKLSASGWDLGKVKANPTTGFSGTSDSQVVLPLSVKQLDLEKTKHTNALVLEYLLQDSNTVELLPDTTTQQTDAITLIEKVQALQPTVQVLLDVGALVLELDNVGVAREWLRRCDEDEVDGVIFVDKADEVSVIDRKDRVEILRVSSFAARPDRCRVFLDEAHTRGIDLKLPERYRAAVTLGANLVKDRLVQACMRMRNLGKGQTIVFAVPEEIAQKISSLVGKPTGDLSSLDVLHWSITETFADARKSMPLWAVQGHRFTKQQELWNGLDCETMGTEDATQFLEDEAQTLEDRYRPRGNLDTIYELLQSSGHTDIAQIRERYQMFGEMQLSSGALQEEQERELSPETEQEKQSERPPSATPAIHRIHPDLASFASTGVLEPNSRATITAFRVLEQTSATEAFDIESLAKKCHLLVSVDYANTIQTSGAENKLDFFQRPAQFVLRSINPNGRYIIVSPYEANILLHATIKSEQAQLCLFMPRINLDHCSMDLLDFFNVPSYERVAKLPKDVRIELMLFSGQLYLTSCSDYQAVCFYFGLLAEPTPEGWTVAADGFIIRDGKGRLGGTSRLTHSPVGFLKALMTRIRGGSADIQKTHIGKIVGGQVLLKEDFEVQQWAWDRARARLKWKELEGYGKGE